jgi:hypothetical protein
MSNRKRLIDLIDEIYSSRSKSDCKIDYKELIKYIKLNLNKMNDGDMEIYYNSISIYLNDMFDRYEMLNCALVHHMVAEEYFINGLNVPCHMKDKVYREDCDKCHINIINRMS